MKVDNRKISEQIGNLIYSIVADQRIKPLEMAELKLLISKDRLSRKGDDGDNPVSDETHFILTTMDSLQAAKVSSKDAFDEFYNFFLTHPEIFTAEVNRRILDKSNEIARIFNADNPSDNEHLKLLRDILGQTATGKV